VIYVNVVQEALPILLWPDPTPTQFVLPLGTKVKHYSCMHTCVHCLYASMCASVCMLSIMHMYEANLKLSLDRCLVAEHHECNW
jgi:hypothetical protein